MTQEVIVRAADPDNEREIVRMSRLFERCFGNTFPIRAVYSPRFWQARIQTRLTSLLLFCGDELCGHLAVLREKEIHTRDYTARDREATARIDSSVVQVCLPAFLPDAPIPQAEIARALLETFSNMGVRQGWNAAYKYLSPLVGGYEEYFTELGGFVVTALYPGCSKGAATPPATSRRTKRTDGAAGPRPEDQDSRGARIVSPVAVAVRVFPAAGDAEPASLFVPRRSSAFIKELLEPLGIDRRLVSGSRRAAASVPHAAHDFDDCRYGIVRRCHRHVGLCQLLVQPSKLPSFENFLRASRDARFAETVVHLDGADPATPAFADRLEDAGWLFCGVIPFAGGRDSLIYAEPSRPLLTPETFISPSAQAIAKSVLASNATRQPVTAEAARFESAAQ